MHRNVSVEDKTRAIQDAVREAVREHALLGRSISVWRDGRIVRLSPAEILAELAAEETHDQTSEGPTQK